MAQNAYKSSFYSCLRLFLVSLFLVLLSVYASAWTVKDGIEIATTGQISDFSMYPTGAGGAVFAWTDARSGNDDIYIQQIDTTGALIWAADGWAIATADNAQSSPKIVTNGDNGYYIAWKDKRNYPLPEDPTDIYVQQINSSNAEVWDSGGINILLNPKYVKEILDPVYDDASGVFIVFSMADDSTSPVYMKAQHIAADSTLLWGDNGYWIGYRNNMHALSAVKDGAGGFVYAYADYSIENAEPGNFECNVYAQRISNSGATTWADPAVLISTSSTHNGIGGKLIRSDTDYYFVWLKQNNTSDTTLYDLMVQLLDANGNFQFGGEGMSLGQIQATGPIGFDATCDISGNLVVVWVDYRNGNADIYGQTINKLQEFVWNSSGAPICTSSGDQLNPKIITNSNGDNYVVWDDSRNGNKDIYAQKVNGSGDVNWMPNGLPICKAANDQVTPLIVDDQNLGLLSGWLDARQSGGSQYGLYAQQIQPDSKGISAGVYITGGPLGIPNPAESEGTVYCAVTAGSNLEIDVNYSWNDNGVGSFNQNNIPFPTWTAPINSTDSVEYYPMYVSVWDAYSEMSSAAYLQAVNPQANFTVSMLPNGSPNPVLTNQTVYCDVSVSCTLVPDDTLTYPLTYQWSAPTGSFSDDTLQSPEWIAPTASGDSIDRYPITVKISNPFGTSLTLNYIQEVRPEDTFNFNLPYGTPNPVKPNATVQVTMWAESSIHEPLMFQWSASTGSFNDTTAQNPIWTAPENSTDSVEHYDIKVQLADRFNPFNSVFYSYSQAVTPADDIVIINGPSGTPNSCESDSTVNTFVEATSSMGFEISYEWSAPTGSFSDNTISNPDWTAPTNSSDSMMLFPISVRIKDTYNDTTFTYIQQVEPIDEITIDVSPSGAPNPCKPSGTANLNVQATSSIAQPISYLWMVPIGSLSSNTSQTPIWTAPTNNTDSVQFYTISVQVWDAFTPATTLSYTQGVEPVDVITVFSGPAGTPNWCDPSAMIQTYVAATSQLGLPLTFLWSAPAGSFTNNAIATTNWTAPTNTSQTVQYYQITIQVSDIYNSPASYSYLQGVEPDDHIIVTKGPVGNPNPMPSQGGANLSIKAYSTVSAPITYNWTCPVGSFSSNSVANPVYYAPLNPTNTTQFFPISVALNTPYVPVTTLNYTQGVLRDFDTNIRNFSLIPGYNKMYLNWQNPPQNDYLSTMVLRVEEGLPWALKYWGAGNTYTDASVLNGKRYLYGVFSYNVSSVYSQGIYGYGIPCSYKNIKTLAVEAMSSTFSFSWSNPPDNDYIATKIIYRTDRLPNDPFDGTHAYWFSGSSYVGSNLSTGTTAYYGIYCYDSANNFSPGVIYGIKFGQTDKNVKNLQIKNSFTYIRLNWTNPTTYPFKGVLIVRRTDRFPTTPTDGTIKYWYNGTTFVDGALHHGQKYYYGIFAHDTGIKFAPGVYVSAVQGGYVNVKSPKATPQSNGLKVQWENPVGNQWYATLVVRRTDRYPNSPADGTQKYWYNGNMFLDNGLFNDMTYYYGIYAHDSDYNFAPGICVAAQPNGGASSSPRKAIAQAVTAPEENEVDETLSLGLAAAPQNSDALSFSILNEAGDFDNAEDVSFWGAQSLQDNSILKLDWLAEKDAKAGVLSMNIPDGGLKLTAVPRIAVNPANPYYRVRITVKSDAEIAPRVLVYANDNTGEVIEAIAGAAKLIAESNGWKTYESSFHCSEGVAQFQWVIGKQNSAGTCFIDSVVIDNATPGMTVKAVTTPELYSMLLN